MVAPPRFSSVFLTLLVLGGCVNLGRSYPEKHYYALEAAHQGEMRASIPGTVLKVRKFRAVPAFEGRELVYRTSDARYEGGFYNEWFVLPNAMLTYPAGAKLADNGWPVSVCHGFFRAIACHAHA